MIYDVVVEIQLHNSRKENCKGTFCIAKKETKKLLLSGHLNFWGIHDEKIVARGDS